MENLHLFTKVEDGLPENKMNVSVVWNGILSTCSFDGQSWTDENGFIVDNFDNDESRTITHWLDLSKLTTKERALSLMEEITDILSGFVNEWQDGSQEQRKEALKDLYENNEL